MRITIETDEGGVVERAARGTPATRGAAEAPSPPPDVAAAAAAIGATDGGPAPTAPGPGGPGAPSLPVGPLGEPGARSGEDAVSAGPAPGAAVEAAPVEVPAEDAEG